MTIEDIKARIPERWGKYVDVGEGWYPLVITLDRHLAVLDPNYTIAQVKSKFGGLRYYLGEFKQEFLNEAHELIGYAEDLSLTMCEDCGKIATQTGRGWIRTACPDHLDRPSRTVVE